MSGNNEEAWSSSENNSSSQFLNRQVFDPDGIKYNDNFDGVNDTTSLKARGYKVWYRGTGLQGSSATWYQGNTLIFSAFNGPSSGYVAADYKVVSGANNIDSWLVLPRISGGILSGDSLYFYERSPDYDPYIDSMRVMFSVSDSVPEGVWTELGRFKTSTSGWLRKGFVAPTSSVNGRFAIRYCIVNGVHNSDYAGIDALNIVGLVGITNHNSETPKEFNLSQNYPDPFNPSTNISYSIPKAGNVKIEVFDILGTEVTVIVNEFKQAGNYVLKFDASKLSSGMYFYKMTSGTFADTKKMILVK